MLGKVEKIKPLFFYINYMKTIYKFAITTGVVLAMSFTLSCTSDNSSNIDYSSSSNVVNSSSSSDDSSFSLSGLPEKVYLDGMEYTGNGDIKISYTWQLSAGSIQNGKVTLNLPESVGDEYMQALDFRCDSDNEQHFCESGFFYTENIKDFETRLNVDIPNKGVCRLLLQNEDSSVSAGFTYSSGAGSTIGSLVNYGTRFVYNVNFSNGWDLLYITKVNENLYHISSALETPVTLTWVLDCNTLTSLGRF